MSESNGGKDSHASRRHALTKTSQVSVGPVAQQLSNRRPRQRRWLAKLFLALCTVACGFIVHAAMSNSPLLSNVNSESPKHPAYIVNSSNHKLDGSRNSPVGTVIELVGAFAHLDKEEAETRNPLALPEDSPTAPVAFYSAPTTDNSNATETFLEQINMESSLDAEVVLGDDSGVAELVGNEQPGSPVVAVGHTEKVSGIDSAKVDVAVAEDSSLTTLDLAATEAVEPLPQADESTSTQAIAGDSSLVATAGEPNAGMENSEPAEVESQEALMAVEAYDIALVAMQSTADRTASRKFYSALSELGQMTRAHDSKLGRQRISEIYGKPKIFGLASSAAASWMRWPKRQSAGIVVAGQVKSVSEHAEGYVVVVQTSDRKSSTLSLVVDQVDFELESTERAVFFGILGDPVADGDPQIQAEFVTASL